MSKTYQATGINLRTQAFGESDRMVTILTREYGLIRAIAPGARKQNSSLGGRSGMFVVNEMLIVKGRSLDKITQAQTIKTFAGLGKNLGKLAASQYLAEIVLCEALSDQPQEELYELLWEHLSRLDQLANPSDVIAHLAHGVFHLLALSGIAPQVQACCLSQRPLIPDFANPKWQVGFSISGGGTVCLQALEQLKKEEKIVDGGDGGGWEKIREQKEPSGSYATGSTSTSLPYETIVHREEIPVISSRLNATELTMLQQLSQPEIMQIDATKNDAWLSVEQTLRHYAQYHFGRLIRSAALIDSYFAANHDAIV
jgi:DNA repair protein RecO (recombination protein O)